jgi:tetratricopeptide (TPR) repeat protein
MAIILHTQGQYEAAITNCKRAISSDPTYFAAYANMGILYQRNGDVNKAIETYSEAIDLKPDFAPAYFNLGTAFESAGEISEAIERYIDAVRLHGDPQSANPKFHGRLATALVEAGHLQRNVMLAFDASRHCRPIGSQCKHERTSLGTASRDLDPSFYLNVGMVYLDTYLHVRPIEYLLDWAGAMFHVAAARSGGDFHTAYHFLGVVHELSDKFGPAVEAYERSIKGRPDSGLYVRALNRLQRSPQSTAQRASRKNPDNGMNAKVDDTVSEVIDRYGCSSSFLTPLRVLSRMARSQPQGMSFKAVTVNPLPPLLSPPPEQHVLSDLISDVYLQGWAGALVSVSARDLKAYKKHFVRRNVSNVSFVRIHNASIEYSASTIHEQLIPSQNRSVDFLQLDNVTCSCDLLASLLNGSTAREPVVPKLVMFQVNLESQRDRVEGW